MSWELTGRVLANEKNHRRTRQTVRKISVIDLVVIVIVLALGAALYLKSNVLGAANGNSEKGTVTYTVTIYGVRDYTRTPSGRATSFMTKITAAATPSGQLRISKRQTRKRPRKRTTVSLSWEITKAARTSPSPSRPAARCRTAGTWSTGLMSSTRIPTGRSQRNTAI
jgi:hypothetical protein